MNPADYKDRRNPYGVAHEINGLKPGQWYTMSLHDLYNMPGDMWRTPLDIIKENLVGFSHGEIIAWENVEMQTINFRRVF